ncbi:DMP19 family protein [Flavobacterium sp. HNIBRBA15423]|uniref:DMP19 family protein n=1 Tax=Flavobacterium sp. HNIBRBA15423 TaxID=3458683 RepID=UPI004044CE64
MKNTTEILQLTDEVEIIEAIGTIIWDKKQEDDTLTEGETNFVLIDIFEGAMNEGGFSFFFKKEAGDYAKEILEAYKKIGAPKTANIIAKAIGLFGINNYYDETEKRKKAIAKLDEKVFSGWEDLDEIFFNDEQEEDIVSLIVNYIKNNQHDFDYK